MNTETLLTLLKGDHINMDVRIEKKIWPHPPLKMSELVKVIVDYLKFNKTFPYEWIEKKNGDLIDDVSVIERMDSSHFMYRSRSAHPINLHKLDESVEKVFDSSELAAEYYLRNDLNLPGDLDGWQVVDDF